MGRPSRESRRRSAPPAPPSDLRGRRDRPGGDGRRAPPRRGQPEPRCPRRRRAGTRQASGNELRLGQAFPCAYRVPTVTLDSPAPPQTKPSERQKVVERFVLGKLEPCAQAPRQGTAVPKRGTW